MLALLAGLGVAPLLYADPEPPPPPAPDHVFYVRKIAPWIEQHCAACHRTGGGGLRLAPATLQPDPRQRHDFEQLVRFVDSQAPTQSRLYRKILDPSEGGDEHAGGPFLRTDEEVHDTFLDFISGATTANVPPEVWFEHDAIPAKPGTTVPVSGRDSYDRDRDDMENLAYWWTLISRPADSRVLLDDRRGSILRLTPDTGGSYVLSLRVGDGKVWSAPRRVTVEAFDRASIERTEPGAVTKLATIDVSALRRVRRLYLDVLGRPPTPGEALAEEWRGPRELVKNVLLRAEAGRAWVEELCVWLGLIGDHRPRSDDARELALRIPAESLSPPVVEATLARDPAFLERHPPGAPLAHAVIGQLLGRTPSEEEVEDARKLAAGVPVERKGVTWHDSTSWLDHVLSSEEFRRAATLRRLRRFLPAGDAKRAIEEALLSISEGEHAWRAFLQRELGKSTYLNRSRLRAKGEVTLLRGLFLDLLERMPTDREMAALVTALRRMPSPTAAYAVIAKILIDSGHVPIPLLVHIKDAPAWIQDRFLRYLGRKASQAELKKFGETLLHPAGGPELVVLALVTSAEYACR